MVHDLARLRRIWLPIVGLVLAAALLAACGDDDDDDATATAAPSTATSAATRTATAAATSTATEAAGEALTISVKTIPGGSYLAGPNGKTLYVFTRDVPGKTNCAGQCLTAWPPLLQEDGQEIEADAAADGTFDTIDTPSGQQVTYNDAPLYYFAADADANAISGDKVGNVWFLARPDTASTFVVGVRDDGTPKTPYLIGPTGMTLYLFANDTPGVSNCAGQCLTNWPALTVPEGLEPTAADDASGELGVFVRDDGARQVTYDGMPLYYWQADVKPTDTTGDGVGGVWSLATP